MRYLKKPMEIQAYRYEFDRKPSWMIENHNYTITPNRSAITINTKEGELIVRPGDYIIQNDDGELSTMTPDLFEKSYLKIMES